MPYFKYCPICRMMKIYRREVKTCGSPECLETWKTLTPNQRARMIERAAGMSAEEMLSSHPGFMTADLSPTRPAEPSIPDKHFTPPGGTVQRDNEFLKKMFGPDAPGVVEEEEDKDKDKDK